MAQGMGACGTGAVDAGEMPLHDGPCLALVQAAPRLRGEVARRMRLKYAPELTFEADPSFREAARIEALLVQERATLARQHEDDDGSS